MPCMFRWTDRYEARRRSEIALRIFLPVHFPVLLRPSQIAFTLLNGGRWPFNENPTNGLEVRRNRKPVTKRPNVECYEMIHYSEGG